MAEDKFEQAVIEKLKSEGWDYLTDYSGVTVDRLYDHWRDILNANNRKRLEDTPLSDNEFEQVKLELTKNKTPYDAQLMLAGAGGVGTVPLNRDDGTQLELEIFYGDEVAGGHSRYEVVNQITFTDLATSLSSKRRIDIMLLINGLPVAHIEEKDESLQNQCNAFEQFQKYDGDGMYTGLFSFVQVQFVLSQSSAHYFARPKNSHSYNRDFAFGWRDDDGKDVTNTMTFIHEVMGIPALHRLPRSLRQTQGQAPGPPYMLTRFKYRIIKHRVEQYLEQSLRIACKALSLDTPPTIPLLGLIGVFR